MALLDEVLPPDATVYPRKFDLLVVDEVHQCAPAGRGDYATDSQRTIALRKIAPHFEHRLFLSATPHNGYTESFTALLELLDPQRFARGVKPSDEAQRRVMVRRLKSELRKELPPRPDGTPRFPERAVVAARGHVPGQRAADPRRAPQSTQRCAAGARGSKSSRTATDFVTLLLKKRLFSSPKAFLETLRDHMRTLSRRGAAEQRVRRAGCAAEFERLEEDVDADEAVDERDRRTRSATAARASSRCRTEEQAAARRACSTWAETRGASARRQGQGAARTG